MKAIAFGPPAWRWLPLALLPLMVAAAYWPGLGGGFAFDDYPNIVENTALHVSGWDPKAWMAAVFSSEAGTLQRPLAMLSFALNHAFSGLDPVAMKATNVAIHAVNALLAYALALQLMRQAHPRRPHAPAASWAAAAWAVHPINLMAVLFVVQRMESLSHTFVLAGLCLYLHGRRLQLAGRRGWPWVATGLCGGTLLGLLSKESAALLPLYAFLAEACLPGLYGTGSRHHRRLLAVVGVGILLAGLAGAGLIWPRVAPAYAMRDFTLVERVLTEGRVVIDYLRWTIAPDLGRFGLYHDDYPISHGLLQPPSTLLALLACAALLGLAVWLRRRRPLVALGLLWFFSAQLLTATVLPLELVYEHRNYFASFGLCIAVADLLLASSVPRRTAGLAALLVVALLFGMTYLRAREWSDPYRFASTEAAKHPGSPRATYALGQVLVVMTGYQPDSPYVPQAFATLERARQVPGAGLLPGSALLLLAANTGQPLQEAWWTDMRRKALERNPSPQDINAMMSLTRCARDRTCTFPPQEMTNLYQALQSHGASADVSTMHGDYALNVLGDSGQALALWRKAVELRPDVPQYRVNLVKLLVHLRLDAEARAQIAELRRLGKLGQNELAARQLEARLERASAPLPDAR